MSARELVRMRMETPACRTRSSGPLAPRPFLGRRHASASALTAVVAAAAAWVSAAAQPPESLLDLTIEELGQIRVTTVSRRDETVNDAAAAVHVITGEEIRRSGIRSLPEALRLAPGVEVTRTGSSSWTISMRGFNSDLSNKLLVLIDGRSVYSPLYAGVFWDAQHVLLEDIDRIEVIAGPAGTMWGANAVNGVINIITRSAWESQGGLLRVGGGTEQEALGAFRYGGQISGNLAARAYAKHGRRDATRLPRGGDAFDDWETTVAGFRLDWELAGVDTLTVQGDVYDVAESARLRGDFMLGTIPEENVPGTIDVGGYNVLARWSKRLARGSEARLQVYVDHTERDIPATYDETRDTLDIDFQHHLPLQGRHDIIWGAGFGATRDDIVGSQFATFVPSSRRDRTYSLFVQDEIGLSGGKLFLTLGAKLEHNDYTGNEYQPNARFAWLVTDRHTFWAALSRAVRIPARLNEDLDLHAPLAVPGLAVPVYVNVRGRDDFDAEELAARELGYRFRLGPEVSFDFALYEHDYDKLQTNEPAGDPIFVPGSPAYLVLPFVQGNGMRGAVTGGTLSANWQALSRWRLNFQYARTNFDLRLGPGSADLASLGVAGNTPERQAGVYSYVELPRNASLYTGVRYVGELRSRNVPSYVAVDMNVDWEMTERLRTSLLIQNLNDDAHVEFGGGNEIERAAYFELDWRF